MTSLTRTDARRRAELLTVHGYEVALELTADDGGFGSRTTIRFDCAGPGVSSWVDIAPAALLAVQLNGSPLDPDTLRDGRLPLRELQASNELVVDARMNYSHDGEGLHRHVDPADGNIYLYATSALAAAPRWFACFDQPDLKAPITLTVRCPPEWTVVANGAAHQIAPGEWRCEPTPPIPTYLATVVAGRYYSVTGEHDGIPLALHVRASLAAHLDREAAQLLELTAACLDEFHRLFGIRYPWGEYHQAFVPEFNWGAMENPGCVTLRDQLIFRSQATDAERARRACTVAHEMAHMWFGDLVTMRWWDDLWLNESFAEYLGHRVYEAVAGYPTWVDFGIDRKAWGYTADRRPSTHPVAGNGAADVASAQGDFDGISYAKGASVLRQLATGLGDEIFLGGLRDYFATHAYGNAELDDLLAAWTAAGAADVRHWAQQWLRTSGMDTISAVADRDGVQLRRRAPDGQRSDRTHAITVAAYDAQGRELARVPATVTGARTSVTGLPATALVLPDAEDRTWARIALDGADWQRLPAMIGSLPAPARVVVCNALRLAVDDAELDPGTAVDIVTALLTNEPDQAIVAAMARWAVQRLVGVYLPDRAARADALERICAASHTLLTGCDAGSGRQLAAARAVVWSCTDPAELRAWLAGDVPAGLALDAELRWALLNRLTALGEVTANEIDTAADQDHSTQGAVHAAQCRALMPDSRSKQETWRTLMSDSRLSNYELYALAEGFWHPDQTELTAPFAARYFEQITAASQLHSGWVLARLALLAYPWTIVRSATWSATEALLAQPGLDARIRRSVVDAGDDLRRALASRVRFAAAGA